MNYQKIYNDLIDKAKERNLHGYVERHHVLPISLGGSHHKNNIVKLTGREHFIAHLLLWKIYRTHSMATAVFLMSKSRGFRINSNEYEKLRITHAEYTSNLKRGKQSNRKGIKLPSNEESIKLRSERRKGKNLGNLGWTGERSVEYKQKMSTVKKDHRPYNYKRVSVKGIEYNSAAEASRELNITYNCLIRRIREEKYIEYFYL